MKKKLTVILIILGVLILGVLSAIALYHMVWNGVILLNSPSKKKYPVRGVDVSHYQGDIDWDVLSGEDIDFAFIKATEGSSFIDDRFDYNFSKAQKCDIAVGAYHFFSFSSPGVTQAENFINTVTPFDGMLPPVVDLEFYGEFAENPLAKGVVDKELRSMLDALEEHYELKPIIYATEDSYELYLTNDYAEYDIWIRNVKTKAKMSDGRQWTFWQYTNRDQLDGYSGEEKFIDMNVFFGSEEDFAAFPRYRLK